MYRTRLDPQSPISPLGVFWAVVVALFVGVYLGAHIRAEDTALACKAVGKFKADGVEFVCRPVSP